LQDDCVAHRDGRTHELPAPRTAKETPHRETQMLVIVSSGEVLIERRPPTGIWGGLWSLPEIRMDEDALALAKSRFAVTPVRGRKPAPLDAVEHGFTHYSLTIYPLEIAIAKREPHAAERGTMWLNLDDIDGAALPAPVKKILNAYRTRT
jgi:A/G-specific adenine glycosylase